MRWEVEFHSDCVGWFEGLPDELQDEIIAHLQVLRDLGPRLGRPQVDTLKGSGILPNMKELRVQFRGEPWRIIFAFDIAERRYKEHLEELKRLARKKLDDYLNKLPSDRRKKVDERAKEIKAQAMSLQELRCAREKSQRELANLLHVQQGEISKLEHRTDMFLSTLRKYIEAVGGRLDIIATFPDTGAVRINQFEDLGEAEV